MIGVPEGNARLKLFKSGDIGGYAGVQLDYPSV
jgi:hypothetical protein